MHNFNLLLNNDSEKKLIIIDDINWSKEMCLAWQKIKASINSGASIDLFQMGIVLIDPRMNFVKHFSFIPWKYKPWEIGLFA